MAKDAAIVTSWGPPVTGREAKSLEVARHPSPRRARGDREPEAEPPCRVEIVAHPGTHRLERDQLGDPRLVRRSNRRRVEGAAGPGGEVGVGIEGVPGADAGRPGLEGEVAAVGHVDLLPGLELWALGVEDEPVEIEDEGPAHVR